MVNETDKKLVALGCVSSETKEATSPLNEEPAWPTPMQTVSASAKKRMKRRLARADVEEPVERPVEDDADVVFERDMAAALAASLAIEEPTVEKPP